MREWQTYTRVHLQLQSAIRPDVRTLSPDEEFAERMLIAGFIPWGYVRMRPGHGRTQPDPKSMMAKARHVVAHHRDELHVQMADTKAASTILTSMLRTYVEENGPMPKSRKQAFTNSILQSILSVKHCALPSGRTWDPAAYREKMVVALMKYCSQSGDRKEAVSVRKKGTWTRAKMSRGAIRYLINGRVYTETTRAQRAALTRNDAVLIITACSKSDFTGEVWGADPIILPFRPEQFNCAACAIVQMEDDDPVYGTDRLNYPLFCSAPGVPFLAGQLDGILHDLLSCFMAKPEARKYSFHSFRSYLAVCLKAAHATNEEIKRMCRWLDDESLRAYCRLDVEATTALLDKAAKVTPSTLTTAQLGTVTDRPQPHLTLGEIVGTNTHLLDAAASNAATVTQITRDNLQKDVPELDSDDAVITLAKEYSVNVQQLMDEMEGF